MSHREEAPGRPRTRWRDYVSQGWPGNGASGSPGRAGGSVWGVHILQMMVGCEWDDETGNINGFWQYAYDGEDFISFDLKTDTYIAPKQQAVITKHKWDKKKAKIAQRKNYLTHICPEWLKKYLDFGRSSLLRTAATLQVSTLTEPHSSGGKMERSFMRTWTTERSSPTNHDGSFQMSVDLKLSSVTPEDWSRYDCVFHLSGVKDDIVTKLDKAEIRTNWGKPGVRSDGVDLIPGERLVAGSLPTGPGRAQPEMATWARLPVGSPPRRKVHEGPVQCNMWFGVAVVRRGNLDGPILGPKLWQ
ncbi:hypothetical protein L3Q82_003173 [Scortum barcoo]|uniref:Uncharacterized protein n=1 Tax=Scortum barcoo TaxID=214431 RepID=A0ACB8VUH2_9TELE|nr:hypothetical protein L3Q82_003173 [Scortum barcoo]